MWLFHKTTVLSRSGLLKGMVDCHSHLLPGVDDGVQSMEESLQILREMEQQGIRRVWLTPHIMEDIPNETLALQRKFWELLQQYRGAVELKLAAEYMLDNLFEERLEKEDLLLLEEGKRFLLVETSYFRWIFCPFCNAFKRKVIILCWHIRNGMNICRRKTIIL